MGYIYICVCEFFFGGGCTAWPAGFTGGDVDVLCAGAGDSLDVAHGAGHVVEEGGGGILDVLTLPEGESVDEAGLKGKKKKKDELAHAL